MEIQYSAKTDPGRKRHNNEDNFYVDFQLKTDPNLGRMDCSGIHSDMNFAAAVCDGMGGEENGEQASLIAVSQMLPCSYDRIHENALATVSSANQKICEMIRQDNGRRSGTTFAAFYADDGKAVTCNVGDSRIYLFRDGRIKRLSRDHSRGQSMIDRGLMTEEQVRQWSGRHELTQYLGIFEEELILEPYFTDDIRLADGDVFLLCSDGLTDMLTDQQIVEILAMDADAVQISEELVQGALEAGGRDNVTVVVLKINDHEKKTILDELRCWNGIFSRR